MQQASAYRKNLIVWLSMLWATVMYFVVMRLVRPSVPYGDASRATVLLLVSEVLLGVSILIRRRALIAMILCEAAAVMGLVSWFVTGSPRSYYCLETGILGLLVHFPRRQR